MTMAVLPYEKINKPLFHTQYSKWPSSNEYPESSCSEIMDIANLCFLCLVEWEFSGILHSIRQEDSLHPTQDTTRSLAKEDGMKTLFSVVEKYVAIQESHLASGSLCSSCSSISTFRQIYLRALKESGREV